MVNQKRKSAKIKAQIVLELLRGKPIEEVSREYQVTVASLSEWRDSFIKNGEAGFKKQSGDSRVAEYERALGRLQMENELLKKKDNFPNSRRGNSFRK
jgi:transposase